MNMKSIITFLIITLNSLCLAQKQIDYTSLIKKEWGNKWEKPTKRTWEIEYRKIDSSKESKGLWHIKGTMFWVRIYPEVFKLEELDKALTYKINGYALDYNYNTIVFYIYGHPTAQKTKLTNNIQ